MDDLQSILPSDSKSVSTLSSIVLDTDTFNEIDDQFAVPYSLLSGNQFKTDAIYAAPFYNKRSVSPEDGMEKSFAEIHRLIERIEIEPTYGVLKGSKTFLSNAKTPITDSEACSDLIERSQTPGLTVVAIGALTNIANALLIDPSLADRITVVWLGGGVSNGIGEIISDQEFNLKQDVTAVQVVLDSKVRFFRIPCHSVASHLLLTLPEIKTFVENKSKIGSYLAKIFCEYSENHQIPGYSKVIWDIAAIGAIIDRSWLKFKKIPTPILSPENHWVLEESRHLSFEAVSINRNAIFSDFFTKLSTL